jgi:phospholipid transport system substrate-binding protein
MKKFFLISFFVALFSSGNAAFAQAVDSSAPDTLVKTVTQQVVDAVRNDKSIQHGDISHITQLVNEKILPYTDFRRTTQLAMGRNWRTATPEQQKQLTDEFRTLLVRTYSGALANYRDNTMDYKPLRMNPGDTEATVRTEVRRSGQAAVQIDYSMEKLPEGWKAYDVIVAGVSLVTNYRDEFNDAVKSSGIDGLIATLARKNAAGATATK